MTTQTKDRGVKQQVRDVLKHLPDNCSFEDVQYQIYLIGAINRSEDSLRRAPKGTR